VHFRRKDDILEKTETHQYPQRRGNAQEISLRFNPYYGGAKGALRERFSGQFDHSFTLMTSVLGLMFSFFTGTEKP